MQSLNFLQLFLLISGIQLFRYSLFTGGAYYFFWIRKNKTTDARRIQDSPFQRKDIIREVSYSVLSSFIFGFMLAIPFYTSPKVYWDIAEHSYAWWVFTVIFLILVNDTYFYWMHRVAHHPKAFNVVHRVHHLSRNPTPFTAYSFHPLETVLEAIWILPILYLMPIHEGATVAFGIFSLFMNTIGHLGVEIYPRSWKTHSVMKWLNTSTHHNSHHKFYNENYGLYFLFWDRWMRTEKLREKLPVPKVVIPAPAVVSESKLAPTA